VNRHLTVTAGAAATRLDVYLAAELALSRSSLAAGIKAGEIRVNDRIVKASYQLNVSDTIDVTIADIVVRPKPNYPDLTLPIIYQDDDIVVVDKPAGIATHGGAGEEGHATVADFARTLTTDPDRERPGIVHRLDKDTSGLLVIARTPAAKTYLLKLWPDRAIAKTYYLLATGRVDPPAAAINLPLDRDPAHPLRRAVVASGRPAITRYQTLATYPGYSYLEATPETGRTHQLRVHLAALGHPIAGDTTYNPVARPLGLTRHFLHAGKLAFTAPSGRSLALESPIPPDLRAVLDHLEAGI
jgi:23S rRNA pseudouridine1911/1915/1917 synthase